MTRPLGSAPPSGPSGAVTALGLALIAAAAAVVTIVVRNGSDSPAVATPSGTVVTPLGVTGGSTAGPGVIPSGTAARAATAATAAAPAVDPQKQAEDSLTLRLFADHDAVEALVGSWVPQLSAKRPGIKDDGITYRFSDIVALHDQLRARFGALMLRSGDYVFKSTDLYVSIAPQAFPTPDGALAFCRTNGLNNNRCFAKLITHDASITDTVVQQT